MDDFATGRIDPKTSEMVWEVKCQYCGRQAKHFKTSDHVHAEDYGPIWHCQPCEAWVGCSKDGGPLGSLAKKSLRMARIAAHEAFDPLVEGKKRRDKCSRSKAIKAGYAWLADQLGIPVEECHIGYVDEATCLRIAAICQNVFA